MKRYNDRLDELKNELEPSLQSRMIFLLNPKDTSTMEAVIGWTVIRHSDFSNVMVDDDATMEDLWKESSFDIMSYATVLGCVPKEAIPRLNQLIKLGIIYPDGTVAALATSIVNVHIKNQVESLKSKSKPKQD